MNASRAASAPHPGIGYFAGLDGIRALAIAAVLVYHGGVAWAGGGFLGVEVFFVLSGFLITSLLVAEWRGTATIGLKAFWARRARRLLPALFCLVVAVGVYEALAASSEPIPGLKGDGLATLFYYGNWHQIATQSNYFAATGPVSPLQHTWSLAIEEQFYIFWPTSLLAAIWLIRRAWRRSRPTDRRVLGTLLTLTLIAAVGSALETALLFGGGRGVNRVYYGTDTRAVSLLTGAALAFGLAIARSPARTSAEFPPARLGRLLGWAALAALAGVLAMMHFAAGGSTWLYPYGMVGLDVAVAAIIAAVVLLPKSAVGRLFSVDPARGLGQISYGVYLWHFPLFLWLTTAVTGLSGTPLLFLRLSATLIVSIVSFVLIEQPVRRRKVPNWLVRSLAPVAMGGACASLFVAAAAAAPPLASAPVPRGAARLQGAQTCRVLLTDTRQYGLSPPSEAVAAVQQPKWLAARALSWSARSRVTFHTCPPKKVLLIGDSLAFSLGLGQMIEEPHYGVEVANAAILGCSFTTNGQINVSGTWESLPPGCASALKTWQHEESVLHPQAVVVELGYRDEFNWRAHRKVEHLGQAGFDAAVQAQIEHYVQALGAGGRIPILFMSVPYAEPRPNPDGSPAPPSFRTRHARINALLEAAAKRNPGHVRFVDIDRVVSPGDRYQRRVNGQLCRFDGVHFTIYCSELAAPVVLSSARSAIAQ